MIVSWSIVIGLTDRPFFSSCKTNRETRACIAIRDDVIPFQKFGTRLFTQAYLVNNYEKVHYMTQYPSDDKKTEFITSLNEALDKYPNVDIFLLSHGNDFYTWLYDIDSVKRNRIRMVYNTGCSGFEQEDIWTSLGADTYVSHIGKHSLSPIFYFFFLRRYANGYEIDNARNESDKLTANLLKYVLKGNDTNRISQFISYTRSDISGDEKLNICSHEKGK